MDLKIEDVSELLNVPEATVLKWIADGKIPAYRFHHHHEYRFSRIEIEDWVLKHKLGKTNGQSPFNDASNEDAASEQVEAAHSGSKQFGLFRALNKGWVLNGVAGASKEEVIRNTVSSIADRLDLDAEVITELLLDREKMHPTALNRGLAVPHTRDFLLGSHQDVVVVAYPETPIQYGALDGQPVHTLFFLFASDDKRHLHLLAKIAHLSHQPRALELLQTKPSKEALLAYIKTWESNIPKSQL